MHNKILSNRAGNQGFTLVELAIVLVIVGLLIGGILVAQSMIETTKIQSFTRQIGQFDAAISNFKDKFSGFPGDETSVAPDGDGDGVIESATANTQDGERGEFWNNLGNTGLKNDNGTIYSADNGVPGNGVPVSKLGSRIGVYVGADTTARVNYYRVAAQGTTVDGTLTDLAATATTVNQALALDTKLDNGTSNTGNLLAITDATADAAGYTVANGAGVCGNAGAYTIAANGNTALCQLAIRVGSTTGDM